MSLAPAPLWTGEQHAWLQALGHTVWVPGSLPAPEAAPAPPSRPARVPAPTSRPVAAPTRARPSAPRVEEPAPETRAPAATTRRGATPLHDPLRFALVRASGLNPNAPEAAQVMAAWPASTELRGNAAAKRALWPQLRALRKRAERE